MSKDATKSESNLDHVLEKEREYRKEKRELLEAFKKETETKKVKLEKEIEALKSKISKLEVSHAEAEKTVLEIDPNIKTKLSELFNKNKAKALGYLETSFS